MPFPDKVGILVYFPFETLHSTGLLTLDVTMPVNGNKCEVKIFLFQFSKLTAQKGSHSLTIFSIKSNN